MQIRERLLKAQAAGKNVFRFESGDPNFDCAPQVRVAVEKALAEGKTHYIPNNGIPELRKALKKKLEIKNKIKLESEENIFVTNGAMHALFSTFTCLLSRGDEVIIPDPMWTEVAENIRLAGGVTVGVPLKIEEGYEYSPAKIKALLSSRTKAIFVNTPHNPTGALLSKENIQKIIEIAKENDLFIISDEAYEDVVFDPYQHHSVASLAQNLGYAHRCVSIFSFSKSYAMSGLRTGYIATMDAKLMDRLPKVLRCSINGVNSLAQWGAVAAVEGDQTYVKSMCNEYKERRDIFMEALKGIPGLKVFEPKGTFFLWAEVEKSLLERLRCRDVDGLSNLLAERGLGSAPGDAFGETSTMAIRFAFSCSTKMVKEGAIILREVLLGQ